MTARPARYGFVGTGSIARAMVEGLSTGPQPPPAIVVSPRGAGVSADLARRFANVTVGVDNQAVVDAAPVVVLASRPEQAGPILDDLRFVRDQVVISAVAGLTLADLRDRIAPATRVARTIPLPSAAVRRGLVPVCPPEPEALAFFDLLGDTIEVESESSFDALSAASAYAAFQLDLLATVEGWLTGRGIAAADARRYVAVLTSGLTNALNADEREFAEHADEHATPGGLNEQIRTYLRAQGVHGLVGTALDDVATRLTLG